MLVVGVNVAHSLNEHLQLPLKQVLFGLPFGKSMDL